MEEETTTPEVVARAEQLGSSRAKDNFKIVLVLRAMPGVRPSLGTQSFMEALAWVTGVDPNQLTGHLPEHVLLGARLLRREKWMTLDGYYRTLDGAPELIRIVKACEGIALPNPRDLRRREAKEYTAALTHGMGEPWGSWLRKCLLAEDEPSAAANDG